MARFEPYISFRDVTKNDLSFVSPPIVQPASALTRGTNLLLLIHGYNNSVGNAADAYAGWLSLQEELGGIGINVVGVYWPGSNWESFAVYMQAISKAEATAQKLATALRAAAASFGTLRIRIVTHSLGSRLTMELLHQLRRNPDPRLTVERFVVMAAAVPTRYLTPRHVLRDALDQLRTPFRSLYSESDKVLGYAFRLGESLRGEGFFPTALGHEEWRGARAISQPQLTQERIRGAGHGDYWHANDQARQAARSARSFLDLGSVARDLPGRDILSRNAEVARDVAGRETPTR